MKIIATAFSRDADKRTGAATIFSGIRIRTYLKLLNRIYRRPGHLRGQLLNIFRYGVIVHTIENKIVLQGPNAVYVSAARATVRGGAPLFSVTIRLDARDPIEKVVPVARGERQIRDHAAFYHAARRSFLGGQQRGTGGYND